MASLVFRISDIDILEIKAAFKHKNLRNVEQLISRRTEGVVGSIDESFLKRWQEIAAKGNDRELKSEIESALVALRMMS